jgi:hypothetical protein
MVYFALANKAKPPMTIAETHGRPTRGITPAVFLGPGRTPKRRSRSLRPPGGVMIACLLPLAAQWFMVRRNGGPRAERKETPQPPLESARSAQAGACDREEADA